MHDVLIIGGGVIGLSLAWDLAKRGQSVQVIDQGLPGREASWAGAGILPAASKAASKHPYEQLRGLACELHPQWAEELQAATGIDTGYRRSGGVHLARTPGEAAALGAWAALLRDEGIPIERVSGTEVEKLEPGIARSALSTEYSVLINTRTQYPVPSSWYYIPDESQLRNPWHLEALVAACRQAGVAITPNTPAVSVVARGCEISGVDSPSGMISARQYCFTAGAWTGQLLKSLGLPIGVLPVRGQMVLFQCRRLPIARIINEGSRYLVPREDGRVLAGSTEEEVGFDKRTTDEAIAELVSFSRSIVPALVGATIEKTWAGLRPGSFDGLPYMGPLPGLKNAFVATGHFRSGLFLSTATAVVMSQLLRGAEPAIDLGPFRVGR
jgi:glycine oxidase